MSNLLFGIVGLDIYTRTKLIKPGFGLLHNAFHLQNLGCHPRLLTCIGTQNQDILLKFFETHHIVTIPDDLIASGESASIKIELQESGEAKIFDYQPGVWHQFSLAESQIKTLSEAKHLHLVMVDEVIPEFLRAGQSGWLQKTFISADFLHFQQIPLDTFSDLLQYLDLAFIGWKGELDDPKIQQVKSILDERPVLLVITLGDRGIQVFDSTDPGHVQDHFFPIEKIPVSGSTNGCGDAFISYFLASYWADRDLTKAIDQGKIGGALATRWEFALPDEAYDSL